MRKLRRLALLHSEEAWPFLSSIRKEWWCQKGGEGVGGVASLASRDGTYVDRDPSRAPPQHHRLDPASASILRALLRIGRPLSFSRVTKNTLPLDPSFFALK
jgi:hypothetical protein